MEQPEGRENRNPDKHTFHLPNVIARETRRARRTRPTNRYRTIPRGEEDDEAGSGSESESEGESDEDTLAGVGVETSREWQSMSRFQHATVRIAFGIFGAAVLLPL
jgi:hypothetical protein